MESALVMPFVLLLVFGIIEFSFAFQTNVVLTDVARTAGRAGASLAGDPGYTQGIADVASEEARKLPGNAQPAALLIYKANKKGYPCGAGATCNEANSSFSHNSLWACWLFPNHSTCVAGTWDPAEQEFRAPTGGWKQFEDDACATSDATYSDYNRIGVAVFVSYDPLTSMFNPILKHEADLLGAVDGSVPWDPLDQHAAFVFEPAPLGVC